MSDFEYFQDKDEYLDGEGFNTPNRPHATVPGVDFVCKKDRVRVHSIKAPVCTDCGQTMVRDPLSYDTAARAREVILGWSR